MSSRSRSKTKPPPAPIPEVARLSPRMQKLIAFATNGLIVWPLAMVVFALIGLAQPLKITQTFNGAELGGSINSGNWSLTVDTQQPTTGETTFFSDVSGFMPVSQNEMIGELHRIQKNTSARWSWREQGIYIWSGNASATWRVTSPIPVDVVVEYDNRGASIFYIFSVVCLVLWVIRLVSPIFEKLLAHLHARPLKKLVQ